MLVVGTLIQRIIFISIYRLVVSIANMDEMSLIRNSILDKYDKHVAPIVNRAPITVSVDIFINDMVPIDKTPMHFSVDTFTRLEWVDPRLAFNHSHITELVFGDRILDDLWNPNIYFLESKSGHIHNLLQKNALAVIYKNGTLLSSQRISLGSYCNMDMKFYPFDIQTCHLSLESYSFNKDYVELRWEPGRGVSSLSGLHTTDFAQVEYTFNSTVKSYGKLGEFTRLTIEFQLFRNLALYILRDFFPCGLIVCLSWVAFWINYKVTPARVAFAITTVLTVVTLTNSVKANSPVSSKFRSIDYYLLFCQLFVFGALAECALVGMASPHSAFVSNKPSNSKVGRKKNNNTNVRSIFVLPFFNNKVSDEQDDDINEEPSLSRQETKEVDSDNKTIDEKKILQLGPIKFDNGDAHIVDRISRIVFPVTFILMNIIYFAFHRLHPDTVD